MCERQLDQTPIGELVVDDFLEFLKIHCYGLKAQWSRRPATYKKGPVQASMLNCEYQKKYVGGYISKNARGIKTSTRN